MAREFAREFYQSVAWKRTREAYKKSVGGLCERCRAKGLISPAEIVHHKVHLSPENINDIDVTLGFGNLEAVCRRCHAEIHEKENGRRWRVDEFGRVTSARYMCE